MGILVCHRLHVQVRLHTMGVCSLLPPSKFQGRNSILGAATITQGAPLLPERKSLHITWKTTNHLHWKCSSSKDVFNVKTKEDFQISKNPYSSMR